jgi:predicted ATP-dependent endonuclease of OLD family
MRDDNSRQHFIKSFEIKKFRGIVASGRVKIPANTQWVFITGENGFGKTSVLQALALGLSGKNIKKGDVTQGLADSAKIAVENSERKYTGKSGKQGYRSVVCYGSSRLNLAIDDKFSSNPIYSLLETNSYLKNIETHLASWYNKKDKYEEFKDKFDSTQNVLIDLLK